MKKRGLIVLIFLLVVFSYLAFVYAQDSGINTTGIQSDAEKIRNATQALQNFTQEDRLDYIGNKTKELLLKNKYVAKTDDFLRSMNILFFVLFGTNYDFSFSFFFGIFLWVLFLFLFIDIYLTYSIFNKGTSMMLAVGSTIITAQLRIFKLVSDAVFKIVFVREGIWGWILFIIILGIIVFLFAFVKLIFKNRRKKKELFAKEQEKSDREVLHKFAKGATGKSNSLFERFREMGEGGYCWYQNI